MNYTLRDIEFYKMYEKWYYQCYYAKEIKRKIEHDLEVGDVVKVKGLIGIVCGLCGLNHNVYVISSSGGYYHSRRYRESELKKLDTIDYINNEQFDEVYREYVDYVEKKLFKDLYKSF